jgi:glycerate 2-kinase
MSRIPQFKKDLDLIIRAGVDAVSARRVIDRALRLPIADVFSSRPVHVIAVGKAAAAMASAFLAVRHLQVRQALAIGTHTHPDLPTSIEWIESSHPFPDLRSQAAGERALALAESVHSGDALVILLSGGASALMAAPIDGISLADKIETTKLMMASGADIHALNTVRRHLSKVKGGRLAAACVGTTVTLAISDVVGDDLNAIGSGPGVPDATTWADAAAALERFGGDAHLSEVRHVIARGAAGALADTPKPGDGLLKRSQALVIGSRIDAMEGARQAALARGYHATVIAEPVTGEAREMAPRWLARVQDLTRGTPRPACVISSGETTVRVTGQGRGGRNLEFALALAGSIALPTAIAMASVGTDGIDGTSGVAGGIVDSTTLARASRLNLDAPGKYLAANDSLSFFAPLDDVVRLGRTDTNVGDLQVMLID